MTNQDKNSIQFPLYRLRDFQKQFFTLFDSSYFGKKTREKSIPRQRQLHRRMIASMGLGSTINKKLSEINYLVPSTHKNIINKLVGDTFLYLNIINLYSETIRKATYDEFNVGYIKNIMDVDDLLDFSDWAPPLFAIEGAARTVMEGFPIRWVGMETVKMFVMTDPLLEFPINAYPFPEVATFLFPVSSGIEFVTITIAEKSILINVAGNCGGTIIGGIKDDIVSFSALSRIFDGQEDAVKDAIPGYVKNEDFQEDLKVSTVKGSRMVVNFLAYLCCAQYEEKEVVSHRSEPVGFSRKQSSLRRPVFIDSTDNKTTNPNPPTGGSHASPVTHWRKGHFANQRYGKNNSQTKIIWRRPVLVNPND